MSKSAVLAAGALSAALAACGSSEPEAVIEQIVVREPGEPASGAAMEVAKATGDPVKLDLVARGEKAFQACSGCHNAEAGAPSMAGPNLHGVVGRKAGALDDYAYSDALASSDFVWDIATLDRFLSNPAGYIEGTSMVAGAVRDGESRAAIVAYLSSTSE
ncbi:MAG: c-type cytochrome [Pseudomonadota bacterium]